MWTLPNILTLSRIVALPLLAFLLWWPNWHYGYGLAFVLYCLMGITDYFDGYLARTSGAVSRLGIFLDPIADKVLIGGALVTLSLLGEIPWWITVLILVREIGITIFRLVVIRDGVIPASKGGKLKTLTQNFGVSFYILPLPEVIHPMRDALMAVAVVLTIWSGIDYIVKWRQSRKVTQ